MPNPDEAIRALRSVDLRAALAAAVVVDRSRLSDEFQRAIVADVERELLRSPFDSDIRDGVRFLAAFNHAAATSSLCVWFNALDAAARRRFYFEAADAFLRHQYVGATRLVLHHRRLQTDWYEPKFHARVLSYSATFLRRLCDQAAELLLAGSLGDPSHRGATHLLAIARDARLLEHLGRAVAVRALTGHEHRALIHFDTERSIEIYAESAERYLDRRDQAESSGWYNLVLVGADVRIFPHENLTALVGDALASLRRAHNDFGADWAARLGDPTHVEAYAKMRARVRGFGPSGYYEVLARRLSIGEIRTLSARNPSEDLRHQLVHHLYRSAGRDAEEFLLEVAAEGKDVFSATQALAMLRAQSAGPYFHRTLRHPDAHVRDVAARGIANLRYKPALPELISALKENGATFYLVNALGRIGGTIAWRALVDSAQRDADFAHVLSGIVYTRDPAALPFVRELMDRCPFGPSILISGLRSQIFDEIVLDAWLVEPPWIADDDLLDRLWRAALAHMREAGHDWHAAHEVVEALSNFQCPTAGAILRDFAFEIDVHALDPRLLRELGSVARRLLVSRGDREVVARAIEEELDLRADRGRWPHVDDLLRFDRELVATALRARIAKGGSTIAQWVELLTHFASADDNALFASIQKAGPPDAADVAHSYLVHSEDSVPRGLRDERTARDEITSPADDDSLAGDSGT